MLKKTQKQIEEIFKKKSSKMHFYNNKSKNHKHLPFFHVGSCKSPLINHQPIRILSKSTECILMAFLHSMMRTNLNAI